MIDNNKLEVEIEKFTLHLFTIGINNYKHHTNLRTAEKGAKDFVKILTKKYGFKAQNCIQLIGEYATSEAIDKQLRTYARTLSANNVLVVYFAGHGEYDEAFTDDTYILPYDAGLDNTASWIDHDKIRKYFGSIDAKHIILISDSCFAGGALRWVDSIEEPIENSHAIQAIKKSSRQVITSGGLEVVQDGGFRGYSIFTHFLIQHLKKSEDQFLSPRGIFEAIKDAVVDNSKTKQVPDAGRYEESGDTRGYFCFLNHDFTKPDPLPLRADSDNVNTNNGVSKNELISKKITPNKKTKDNSSYKIIERSSIISISTTVMAIFIIIFGYIYLNNGTNSQSNLDDATPSTQEETKKKQKAQQLANSTKLITNISTKAKECNHLASDFRYPGVSKEEIVPFFQIDIEKALPACEASYREDPRNERLAYQYARTLKRQAMMTRDPKLLDQFIEFSVSLCNKGHGEICHSLGNIYYKGTSHLERDVSKGFDLYERACTLSSFDGCIRMGQAYRDGKGVVKNQEKAFSIFKTGCELDDPDSCVYQGYSLQLGIGSKKNIPQAKKLYEEACTLYSAWGCSRQAELYQKGIGVEKDPKKAFNLFQKGCDGDNVWGCRKVGQAYREGEGVEQNREKSFSLFKSYCENGDAVSCTYQGYAFENGLGIAKDLDNAKLLYEQSCSEGSAWGCSRQAELYQKGIGVEKDPKKTFSLFQKGCDGGDDWGCQKVGQAYRDGKGVEQNREKSFSLFKSYCENGDAVSCTYQGYAFENGLGIAKDLDNAKLLYEQSCSEGDAWGCSRQAELYLKGIGVENDPKKAFSLFQKGCDGGDDWGCEKSGDILSHSEILGQEDYEAAAEMYKKACDFEQSRACAKLGELHRDNKLISSSSEDALKFFDKGCTLGRSWGCREAGLLVQTGKVSLIKDSKNKSYYFKKTISLSQDYCEKSWFADCRQLGHYYNYGEIVDRNMAKSIEYYTKGCEGNDAESCSALGTHNYRNPTQAASYFKQACELEYAAACANYGILQYENGESHVGIESLMKSLEMGSNYLIARLGNTDGNKNLLKDLQRELRNRGTYLGSIDGIFGAGMKNAMEETCGC